MSKLTPTHKNILFKKLLTLPPENPFWDNSWRFNRPVFTQESRFQRGFVTQPKVKHEGMSDEVFSQTSDLHAANFFAWFDGMPSRFQKDIVKLSKDLGCKYV
jgi:hypothetical protein